MIEEPLSYYQPAVREDRTWEFEWYSWLTRLVAALNLIQRGEATFAAGATVAVTLPVPYSDTNYLVMVGGGNVARQYAVHPGDRTTTGFTITASAVNSDTVWWRAERLA